MFMLFVAITISVIHTTDFHHWHYHIDIVYTVETLPAIRAHFTENFL